MREPTFESKESPLSSRDFLEKLRAHESISMDSRVAVVVAHPDDESIAFGAQLMRFPNSMMVHVTDGAPMDPKEWQKKGFETQQEYADVRERELNTALNIAGHTGLRVSLGFADQEAALRLAESAERLVELFLKHDIKFALTHSYEGGHPDHDATAFAVHAAKALLEKKNVALNIIEAPLYRVEGGKSVRQRFVPLEGMEVFELPLTKEQRELKRNLFAAHASQSEVFDRMSKTTEWLREAPRYDFAELPNEGQFSHIFTDADISAQKWQMLSEEALRSLHLKNPYF